MPMDSVLCSKCPVVYFSEQGQTYTSDDLKVPVFQKGSGEQVPLCYCFGWSLRRIREEIEQFGASSALTSTTSQNSVFFLI